MKKLESSEDYLERILMLTERNNKVRSIDIVNDMNFSKPSISIAMKKLKENGYIEIDNEGYILLTNSGLNIARDVYERHQLLTKALIDIGVPENIARIDACKIEHDISLETFKALKKHLQDKLR